MSLISLPNQARWKFQSPFKVTKSFVEANTIANNLRLTIQDNFLLKEAIQDNHAWRQTFQHIDGLTYTIQTNRQMDYELQ